MHTLRFGQLRALDLNILWVDPRPGRQWKFWDSDDESDATDDDSDDDNAMNESDNHEMTIPPQHEVVEDAEDTPMEVNDDPEPPETNPGPTDTPAAAAAPDPTAEHPEEVFLRKLHFQTLSRLMFERNPGLEFVRCSVTIYNEHGFEERSEQWARLTPGNLVDVSLLGWQDLTDMSPM
jgi:hypothetical protein